MGCWTLESIYSLIKAWVRTQEAAGFSERGYYTALVGNYRNPAPTRKIWKDDNRGRQQTSWKGESWKEELWLPVRTGGPLRQDDKVAHRIFVSLGGFDMFVTLIKEGEEKDWERYLSNE